MKLLLAFAVVSLSVLSSAIAEEEKPKFSLIVRWTPPGGEAVETKVPDLALFTHSRVQVPVSREGGVDPVWTLEFDFDLSDQTVMASLNDHAHLRAAKDGGAYPVEIAEAAFDVVWNQETFVFESAIGKLSFVPELEGELPTVRRGNRVPDDLAEKIEFSHKVADRTNLLFQVYNPTEYEFNQAVIRVVIPASEGHAALDRLYQIGVSWPPLRDGDGSFNLPKLTEYPEGTVVQVTLEKAF